MMDDFEFVKSDRHSGFDLYVGEFMVKVTIGMTEEEAKELFLNMKEKLEDYGVIEGDE